MDEQSLLEAVMQTHLGVLVTDAQGHILRVNTGFTELTGYSEEEVLGKTPRMLKSDRHDAAFYKQMWKSLLGDGRWSGEIWNRHKSGRIFPESQNITAVKGPNGRTRYYVAIFADISARKQQESVIEHEAHYDALTDLPNRRYFEELLRTELSRASRRNYYGGLLFIDLDHFKQVNDTLGHHYGDALLKEVAGRLQRHTRREDSCSRFGGDEFVVLLPDLGARQEAASASALRAGEHLLKELCRALVVDEHEIPFGASIGVATFSGEESPLAVIREADAAMYRAKTSGRNQVSL